MALMLAKHCLREQIFFSEVIFMLALINRCTVFLLIITSLIICSGATISCAATAAMSKNLSVANCNPCKFEIAANLIYSITCNTKRLPDNERIVEALQVTKSDKPGWEQRLTIHNMSPIDETDDLFLGFADVNFDGYDDLFFATSRGATNTYVDYWLYTPSTGEFSYFGNYPIFSIDTDKQMLSTYEKGGHGGMIYTANRYRFVNGKLVLVESEKQEAIRGTDAYKSKRQFNPFFTREPGGVMMREKFHMEVHHDRRWGFGFIQGR